MKTQDIIAIIIILGIGILAGMSKNAPAPRPTDYRLPKEYIKLLKESPLTTGKQIAPGWMKFLRCTELMPKHNVLCAGKVNSYLDDYAIVVVVTCDKVIAGFFSPIQN